VPPGKLIICNMVTFINFYYSSDPMVNVRKVTLKLVIHETGRLNLQEFPLFFSRTRMRTTYHCIKKSFHISLHNEYKRQYVRGKYIICNKYIQYRCTLSVNLDTWEEKWKGTLTYLDLTVGATANTIIRMSTITYKGVSETK
jgi:hypothetical protein